MGRREGFRSSGASGRDGFGAGSVAGMASFESALPFSGPAASVAAFASPESAASVAGGCTTYAFWVDFALVGSPGCSDKRVLGRFCVSRVTSGRAGSESQAGADRSVSIGGSAGVEISEPLRGRYRPWRAGLRGRRSPAARVSKGTRPAPRQRLPEGRRRRTTSPLRRVVWEKGRPGLRPTVLPVPLPRSPPGGWEGILSTFYSYSFRYWLICLAREARARKNCEAEESSLIPSSDATSLWDFCSKTTRLNTVR